MMKNICKLYTCKTYINSYNSITFFQRDTDGQQAHEKMFNITNHQGNKNQDQNEVTGVGKDVRKKEPLCFMGM